MHCIVKFTNCVFINIDWTSVLLIYIVIVISYMVIAE